MSNIPYVKQYKEDGTPIEISGYKNHHPNRKERRIPLQKYRFYGESKNKHLTLIKIAKYHRVKQNVLDKQGKLIKTIEHYLLKQAII